MAGLYHLLQQLFSALLFLIGCLGTVGQFLFPWAANAEQTPKANKAEMVKDASPMQRAGGPPLNGVQIQYPADMIKAEKNGKVVLTCDIETTGKTSNCKVVTSSGEPAFDTEALHYVTHAVYRPATKNGKPIKELEHHYTVRFKLAPEDTLLHKMTQPFRALWGSK